MAKHSIIGRYALLLLIVTSAGLAVVPSANSASETYIETYNVSINPPMSRFFLDVLIPPDASVLSMQIGSVIGNYQDFNMTYSGCFNLRCYKFAQAAVAIQNAYSGTVMNFTVTVRRNSTAYLPCTQDIIADTIMQRLKAEPVSMNFMPGLVFANLANADSWRGYPIIPVNKTTDYQFTDKKIDYVIVGSNNSYNALNDLMVLKSQQGLDVFFMSTEAISANYGGGAIQYKTIEFLKDAYNHWHMPYVLLVGNTETLPAIPYTTYNFNLGSYVLNDSRTTDYYYSTLDQPASEYSHDWPYRASIDFPDFILGRFPFDSPVQVASLVQKTIAYENNTQANWVRKNLIVAGYDLNGQAETPEAYTNDRPKDLLLSPGNYTFQNFVNEVNSGVGSVLIMARSDATLFAIDNSSQYFGIQEVAQLNNTRLPVIFTLSSHSGKFDATPSGNQSIAVTFLAKENSGAVAMVSGMSYTAYGPFVYYSAYNYWNQCANPSMRVPDAHYNVGKAFYYFNALNPIDYMDLLGDPALQLATASYDLPPDPSPTPVATPTLTPEPSTSPSVNPPSTATPNPTQSSSNNGNSNNGNSAHSQPTPKPTVTISPTVIPEQTIQTNAPTPKPTKNNVTLNLPFTGTDLTLIGLVAVIAMVLVLALFRSRSRQVITA